MGPQDLSDKVPMPAFAMRRRAVIVLLWIGALAGLFWWGWQGRPVTLPDAHVSRMSCISYTPFRGPHETPYDLHAHVSRARIERDMALLSKRFGCVRTYSQSLGMDQVTAIAAHHGMKVLMGIWLSADAQANRREVAMGIAAARAHPGAIRAIVVGNEVLLRGELAPQQLVAYLHQVHKATGLPVTYADVWEFWQRYGRAGGLAQAVSFVTVHILPYWEDNPVPVAQAVAHVARVYARMAQLFPHKRVLIGETGWPSEGRTRRGAVPSRVNEARYVRGFVAYARTHHIPYNLIESFDQAWKRVQEGTVGGYWGIYDARSRPKFALHGPVTEIRQWWWGWLAALAGALCCGVLAARDRALAVPAGLGLGLALAAAVRQMSFALIGPFEWTLGIAVCALAMVQALLWIRGLAGAGAQATSADWANTRAERWLACVTPAISLGRQRYVWLLAAAVLDVLLLFDGRYRDFPVALMWLPAVGLTMRDISFGLPAAAPAIEERVLAVWLVLSAVALVGLGYGLNLSTWWWLAIHILLVWPVLVCWRRTSRFGVASPLQRRRGISGTAAH